mmetsp:Transcript_19655/g.43596  ORF Transcript_19655/g.43596 Transcript_19655/m.43596 type:complete len:285 (+) Transcript_19655:1003-1857(+)
MLALQSNVFLGVRWRVRCTHLRPREVHPLTDQGGESWSVGPSQLLIPVCDDCADLRWRSSLRIRESRPCLETSAVRCSANQRPDGGPTIVACHLCFFIKKSFDLEKVGRAPALINTSRFSQHHSLATALLDIRENVHQMVLVSASLHRYTLHNQLFAASQNSRSGGKHTLFKRPVGDGLTPRLQAVKNHVRQIFPVWTTGPTANDTHRLLKLPATCPELPVKHASSWHLDLEPIWGMKIKAVTRTEASAVPDSPNTVQLLAHPPSCDGLPRPFFRQHHLTHGGL